MKKALITGITGQDGAYLAELLLEKGYLMQAQGDSQAAGKAFAQALLLWPTNAAAVQGLKDNP